jgi:hypothetical protein
VVLIDERAFDRRGQSARPDREHLAGGAVVHDGFVSQAVDHRRRDRSVYGCQQAEEQSRGARGDQRQRNHPSAQTPLAGVLVHHFRIRDLIATADLEDRARRDLQSERREQVLDYVLDRNRLGSRLDPAGRRDCR